MSSESSVSGVITGYLASAVIYVIILTRLIPLTQYGYYNSLLAMMGIFSLFFPTLGIDVAIAREAAMLHARDMPFEGHMAAILLISIILTTAYSLTLFLAIPLYIISKIPSYYLGIVYIYIAWIITQAFTGVLSTYLWIMSKLRSQGVGNMLYSLVFRPLEVALLVVMHSVYAIIISILIGQLTALLYYMLIIRRLPNPLKGLALIKNGLRRYLNTGFQNWIISYIGSIGGYALTYLVYLSLGPEYVAIYNLVTYMLGAVTTLTGSVSNVFSSKLSHVIGAGGDTKALVRDYAISIIVTSGVLSQLAMLTIPLLPILSIVHGDYVRSIPYAMLLLASAVISAPVSIYTVYYWVLGKGWHSVKISALGVTVGLLIFIITVKYLGFYSVILSSYASSISPLIAFI
ncbi:oligosaccharide flippase family protein [Caldivirga maquilingensis]|uniref:Polysaccharide biosynthesis protein n=1 Tax=Caldivirga maquilingensis (strain ATCC 700844 / DSM 13496 / JCM 10307 / IC-167) TaxID=397948 RepID=A8M968_CALMQ|nr:oligosaccharide flippase family protein [Caldivirga maquilingensis]ABW02287.1 polysaccharide biosynthesis protein [Caldivirga maquilingensis IC-167]